MRGREGSREGPRVYKGRGVLGLWWWPRMRLGGEGSFPGWRCGLSVGV
jgi:hypothetical protein